MDKCTICKCLASAACLILFIYIGIKVVNFQKKTAEGFDVSSLDATSLDTDLSGESSSAESSSEESVSTYAQALDSTIATMKEEFVIDKYYYSLQNELNLIDEYLQTAILKQLIQDDSNGNSLYNTLKNNPGPSGSIPPNAYALIARINALEEFRTKGLVTAQARLNTICTDSTGCANNIDNNTSNTVKVGGYGIY